MVKDAPLVANLAALWAKDAVLAGELDAPGLQPYPVESTKSGLPTVALATADGRRIYFHSRHQPIEEARRLIDACELDQKGVFAVHGFGLGYHIDALIERISEEAVIVVFEPDLRMLRTALEQRDFSSRIESGRLLLLTRAERGPLMLRLGNQQALVTVGISFIDHPPSQQLHREFHQQMHKWTEEFAAYCRTAVNTLVINGRRTCQNIARNLGWYVAAPGIGRLKNRHAAQPAIIVSAGPSLRKNKHLLAAARPNAVVIAVQTTLQPLLEMGVEPHYATSLDYHEISTRFFEKLPRQLKTELVAEPKASSAVLKLFPGPLSLLGNEFADELLREMKLDKPRLRSGATVAHLAFYLAEHMGCDPIIFIGQDLGFTDGLCYAPGTSYEDVWRPELSRFCTMEMKQWEHIARDRPILRKIADWQGRPMYTEERLFTYLQQFERDFSTSSAKIIDATEGGALKHGAVSMTLAEALDRYCGIPLPLSADETPACRDDLNATARASLLKRRDEAGQIAAIGRETLPLLEEVREHLDDQSRVNRNIAAIDALRAKMNVLNDCYELVTQLSQQTELARFHSDRQIAAARLDGAELQRRQIARDILNVQGIIGAAEQFIELMDEAVLLLRDGDSQ